MNSKAGLACGFRESLSLRLDFLSVHAAVSAERKRTNVSCGQSPHSFFLNISLIRVAISFLLSFLFPLSLSLEVYLFTSEFLVTFSLNASFGLDLNSSWQFG